MSMTFSVDYLGGARYASTILRYHNMALGAGVFADVDGFGPAYDLISKLAAKGCKAIKVPLMWKDGHDFSSRDFPTMEKRAAKVNAIAKRFPGTTFYVGGGWEHKLDATKARQMAAKIKAKAPNCIYINCPMKGGAALPEELNEFHYEAFKTPPRGIPRYRFSFDGKSCADLDLEKIKRDWERGEDFAFWIPQDNGKINDRSAGEPGADTTPRAKRKGWPKGETCRAQCAWATPRAINSPSTKTIYKPLAEQTELDTANDTRACRPVIITPQKADELLFVASNGTIVARAKRYRDPYHDGRWRYYCSKWGYQIAKLAINASGSPVVTLRVGRTNILDVDPSYRGGSHR